MLVLSRKQGERIVIGQDVEVTVLEIRGNRIKLGVSGPPQVPVQRQELLGAARSRRAAPISS